MSSRLLVIISEDNEGNASVLNHRACELGADVRLLVDSEFGESWSLSLSSQMPTPVLVDHKRGEIYDLSNPNICYYFRSSHFFENPRLCQPYSLINEYLETKGYQLGNFLTSQHGHTMSCSKPINMLQLPQVCIPRTFVGHQIPRGIPGSSRHIIKGLSSIRTQAVTLDDHRLVLVAEGRQETPVLIQERIVGRDIKTIFYRCRNGQFIFLPTSPTKNEKIVDYRFQEDFNLELCEAQIPWEIIGEELSTRVGSRFFDADFILTTQGELYFLEVNMGPSGIAEEKQIVSCPVDFSRQFLSDWLSIPCL